MFDQILSAGIGRMGFTRKYKLYRSFGIIYDFGKAIEIGKKKMSPFIGCKSARKTDEKSIRIDLFPK